MGEATGQRAGDKPPPTLRVSRLEESQIAMLGYNNNDNAWVLQIELYPRPPAKFIC